MNQTRRESGWLAWLAFTPVAYAAVVVGFIAWTATLPDSPGCDTNFACSFSQQDGARYLGMLLGLPIIGVSIAASMGVLVILRSRMRSGATTAVMSVLAGLVLTGLGSLIWVLGAA